ncbi:hypothetical protein [Desulfobacter postgatei]|uniref:hypothetical protein n=1 Tax=Desulfobacter postgatei TaxID=2293 RepID=UPI00259BA153|nr:hypothetical protein [uncultured Desulfobacter sp.]
MTESNWVTTTIGAATAFGTVAVAVLAIWGERVRAWLAPAKLSLEPHNLRGDPNIFTADSKPVARVMYYHLKVVNKRPWLPVKNCRVLLKGISRRGPDNIFHPFPLVVPPQMVWAPASFAPILATITTEQILDLGLIVEGQDKYSPALYSTPNNFAGFVRKDEAVRYELSIEADNYSSRKYQVFEVAWDGEWAFEPEEMAKHLRIREVQEP